MDILGLQVSIGVLMGILIPTLVLTLIGAGGVLKKSGENPWKILIPIYGTYCYYRAANSTGVFWGTIVMSGIYSVATTIATSIIASKVSSSYYFYSTPNTTPLLVILIIYAVIMLILQIVFCRNLADTFGKGGGFAAGLFFLYPVFLLILAFGSAQCTEHRGYNNLPSATGSWECPKCGTKNPVSRGTCQNCGTQK